MLVIRPRIAQRTVPRLPLKCKAIGVILVIVDESGQPAFNPRNCLIALAVHESYLQMLCSEKVRQATISV